MLAGARFSLLPNFVDNRNFLQHVYSSLIFRFNGDGTLIPSENSFLALT
jgi:hypothetical protein